MADDQETSKEVGDEIEASDQLDYVDTGDLSTAAVEVVADKSSPSVFDDYDDEPIEDYVVKLVVNEESDLTTTARNLVDTVVADNNGNPTPSKVSEILDNLNTYSTTVFDELNGQTNAITDRGKNWFGWSTRSWIIFGLIALCILGLILACLFLILGKKRKNNKRTTTTGSTTTTKAVVNKGVAPDQKYQQVPNV